MRDDGFVNMKKTCRVLANEWSEKRVFLDGKNQPMKNQYFATEVQMCIAETRELRRSLSALMQKKSLMMMQIRYFRPSQENLVHEMNQK